MISPCPPTVGRRDVNGTEFSTTLGDPAGCRRGAGAQNFPPQAQGTNHPGLRVGDRGGPCRNQVEQVCSVGLARSASARPAGSTMGYEASGGAGTDLRATAGAAAWRAGQRPRPGGHRLAADVPAVLSAVRAHRAGASTSDPRSSRTVEQLIINQPGQTCTTGAGAPARRSRPRAGPPVGPGKLMAGCVTRHLQLERHRKGGSRSSRAARNRSADIALKASVSVRDRGGGVNLEQLYCSLTQGQYTPGTGAGESGLVSSSNRWRRHPAVLQVQQAIPAATDTINSRSTNRQPYQPQPEFSTSSRRSTPQQGYPQHRRARADGYPTDR